MPKLVFDSRISYLHSEQNDKKKLDKKNTDIEQEFYIFQCKHIIPLLSVDPSSVVKYLEENALESFIDLSTIMLHMDMKKNIKNMMNSIFKSTLPLINDLIKNSKDVFSESTLENYKETFFLEINNEIYLLNKYGMFLFNEEFGSRLVAEDIDIVEFFTNTARLYLGMFSLHAGLTTGNKNLEPILNELSKISLQYAEEKDAIFTTIDYVLDKEKNNVLSNAYHNYAKNVAHIEC